MCVCLFSPRVKCKCLCVCVCLCVHQLSGCEMAIWGHTSGPVWQWARVIIRSQWDTVLFLPRVRCLSGPVSSHLDGWASLLRALAHLPSAPKTNWLTSLTQTTVTSPDIQDKSALPTGWHWESQEKARDWLIISTFRLMPAIKKELTDSLFNPFLIGIIYNFKSLFTGWQPNYYGITKVL